MDLFDKKLKFKILIDKNYKKKKFILYLINPWIFNNVEKVRDLLDTMLKLYIYWKFKDLLSTRYPNYPSK